MRIVEKGGDFGGTWYWNRYPGAQCDTASFVYMPLLEETGHMPTEKYAHAPEILEHCQRIGKQFGLYDNALFHTEVTDLEWDDARSRWIVRTNRGDEFTATLPRDGHRSAARPEAAGHPRHRVVPGPLVPHQPLGLRLHGRRPARRADGPARRQARRDHRHRRDVRPVRPAPRHARRRSCSCSSARRRRSTCATTGRPIPDWFAEIATPGWQQRWLENFTANQTGQPVDEDLVQDGWTDISRRIRSKIMALPPDGVHAARR